MYLCMYALQIKLNIGLRFERGFYIFLFSRISDHMVQEVGIFLLIKTKFWIYFIE